MEESVIETDAGGDALGRLPEEDERRGDRRLRRFSM